MYIKPKLTTLISCNPNLNQPNNQPVTAQKTFKMTFLSSVSIKIHANPIIHHSLWFQYFLWKLLIVCEFHAHPLSNFYSMDHLQILTCHVTSQYVWWEFWTYYSRYYLPLFSILHPFHCLSNTLPIPSTIIHYWCLGRYYLLRLFSFNNSLWFYYWPAIS